VSRRLPGYSAWLLLFLAIPACLPLVAPGYFFNAHDGHHSVFFLVEFDRAIKDGVLWPVWGPDHAVGFGYPLWLIYAPLAYFVAEAFHLLGFGFTIAVKLAWLLFFGIGAVGMYRVARRWWGPSAALVAGLAYTYAPYHLVQIYVRAALAEFAALAWFPWVLLALLQLWESPGPRRAALAALSFGLLLLTHTVSALIFGPLLGGFLLLEIALGWRRRKGKKQDGAAGDDVAENAEVISSPTWPSLAWAAGALILGMSLAAIFLLPMLFERRYIVEAQWVDASYDYRSHFVYPSQFFSPDWGYGYSTPGPNDGMSFQIGLIIFIGAAVGGLAALQRRGDPIPHRAEALFLAAAGVLALFAMTPAAKPIWDALPLVGLVQFPWRLLAVVVVTLPLLVGAGVYWLEQWGSDGASAMPGPYVYVVALAVVLASYPYARPELLPVRPEDESPLAVMAFELKYPDMRGMTRWSQRLPANEDSPLIAQYLAGAPLERAVIAEGQGAILEQQSAAASASAHVRADGSVRLRFYTYYFPGWRATVDGKPVEIAIEPPNGLINVSLPPGDHQVRLRFGSTPLRRASAAISILVLVTLVALWVAGRRGVVSSRQSDG